MPMVYQQNINAVTRLGLWHITEPEEYFQVPVQREITHWHKRLQHLAGRLLLKELYPEFPVSLIRIDDTRKPYLENESFHFSISHSGDYAAVIVSKEFHVGVDVELIKSKISTIIHKFLGPEEFLLLPPNTINESAILCWSVKESIFKWIGTGRFDFKKDIIIKKIIGHQQGIVHCIVNNKIALDVYFLVYKDNYLTWVIT